MRWSLRSQLGLSNDDVLEVFAIVDINGNMALCQVDGWTVTLISRDAALAKRLHGCSIGHTGIQDCEIVVSINGSSLVTPQEALQAWKAQQQKAKQEHLALVAEAERVRAEAEATAEAEAKRRSDEAAIAQLRQWQLEAKRHAHQKQLEEQQGLQQLRVLNLEAGKWNPSFSPISLEDARGEMAIIRDYESRGASTNILKARAVHLKRRCLSSPDMRDSRTSIASGEAPISSSEAAKAGAVVGGMLCLFGGPLAVALGAAIGGAIGGMAADETNKNRKETAGEKWARLLLEIDNFLDSLPAQ